MAKSARNLSDRSTNRGQEADGAHPQEGRKEPLFSLRALKLRLEKTELRRLLVQTAVLSSRHKDNYDCRILPSFSAEQRNLENLKRLEERDKRARENDSLLPRPGNKTGLVISSFDTKLCHAKAHPDQNSMPDGLFLWEIQHQSISKWLNEIQRHTSESSLLQELFRPDDNSKEKRLPDKFTTAMCFQILVCLSKLGGRYQKFSIVLSVVSKLLLTAVYDFAGDNLEELLQS